MKKFRNLKGFTLVEILIVIALIAILATIAIVAINPARNFAQARNTERKTEIASLQDVISRYIAEGGTIAGLGALPTCPAVENIGNDATAGDVDLREVLAPEYLARIPHDPGNGSVADAGTGAYDTNYNICTLDERVTISAPSAELGEVIELTR